MKLGQNLFTNNVIINISCHLIAVAYESHDVVHKLLFIPLTIMCRKGLNGTKPVGASLRELSTLNISLIPRPPTLTSFSNFGMGLE